MGLVACPFCREMFEEGEARSCPVCGMTLKALDKLPPSLDAASVDDAPPLLPEHEPLAFAYLGRERGMITALGVVGICLFFLPWVRVTLPDIYVFSGFDLARRLGWSWGAGVAWTVLIPTVLSRRTIFQMRGARVAAAFLALVPAVTVMVLLARPPRGGLVPVRFTWEWPLYATFAVSVVAAFFGTRFGGKLEDITVTRGSSRGQDLH